MKERNRFHQIVAQVLLMVFLFTIPFQVNRSYAAIESVDLSAYMTLSTRESPNKRENQLFYLLEVDFSEVPGAGGTPLFQIDYYLPDGVTWTGMHGYGGYYDGIANRDDIDYRVYAESDNHVVFLGSNLTNCEIEVAVDESSDNYNYTWEATLTIDGEKLYTLQDTFSVPGNKAYKWVWGEDNYSFINSRPPFSENYYLSSEDFNAMKKTFSKVDLKAVGEFYGASENNRETDNSIVESNIRLTNFLNNNTRKWTGSCYGMALTVAFFKTFMLGPAFYGGSSVNKIQFNKVESIINFYHMSQAINGHKGERWFSSLDERFNDSKTLIEMYNAGKNVQDEKSVQQPFLYYLWSSKEEKDGSHKYHCVLCYGAESGSWKYKGVSYDRRLLIADPNKTKETYVYINSDASRVVYSGDKDYDWFGYCLKSLSELNSYNHNDAVSNYRRLNTYGKNIRIKNNQGQATIIGETIKNLVGQLPIRIHYLTDEKADDDPITVNYYYEWEDSSNDYYLVPVNKEGTGSVEQGVISATISSETCSTGLFGVAKHAEVGVDGDIILENASGEVSISVTDDDSDYGFVTITGKADGDVYVTTNNNEFLVSGALSDYTFTNMNRDTEIDKVLVHGDIDSVVSIDGEKISAQLDVDSDGTYDTVIDSSHSNHIYYYKNNDGETHTAICKLGDDEFNEKHLFSNGKCEKCGAKSDTSPADSVSVLNGIVKGSDGKWAMYKNNKVDKTYTGIAKNQYGWWRVKNGYVDFNANGIYKNEYGWWKTTDGKVTFKETGVFKNEYGWWRVEDSKVNFKANGIYKNQHGWWKTTNGKVTFKETGVFKNEYGWWRVKDSKVDFKAQGIYQNQYGWWKTTNGKVTFKENGVFQNEYGWWKVKDSKVDFNFTGIASNKYGKWYIKNGKVDFSKNGKVIFNNRTYIIKTGKVQE